MIIKDYGVLGCLHDALFVGITFSIGQDGLRQLKLAAICDEECGYDAWAGNCVEILFVDTLVVSGSLLGHVSGEESINNIETGLLADAERTVAELTTQGIGEPKARLTLVLQSGSELSIACEAVEVTVLGE